MNPNYDIFVHYGAAGVNIMTPNSIGEFPLKGSGLSSRQIKAAIKNISKITKRKLTITDLIVNGHVTVKTD